MEEMDMGSDWVEGRDRGTRVNVIEGSRNVCVHWISGKISVGYAGTTWGGWMLMKRISWTKLNVYWKKFTIILNVAEGSSNGCVDWLNGKNCVDYAGIQHK